MQEDRSEPEVMRGVRTALAGGLMVAAALVCTAGAAAQSSSQEKRLPPDPPPMRAVPALTIATDDEFAPVMVGDAIAACQNIADTAVVAANLARQGFTPYVRGATPHFDGMYDRGFAMAQKMADYKVDSEITMARTVGGHRLIANALRMTVEGATIASCRVYDFDAKGLPSAAQATRIAGVPVNTQTVYAHLGISKHMWTLPGKDGAPDTDFEVVYLHPQATLRQAPLFEFVPPLTVVVQTMWVAP